MESLAAEMLELQSQIRQGNAEVNELEERLPQRDADVKNLQRQVPEIAVQLHKAKSASRARRQHLSGNAIEHRDRMQENFERAATQWRDQVVEFAVTGMDHFLQNLCKRDK